MAAGSKAKKYKSTREAGAAGKIYDSNPATYKGVTDKAGNVLAVPPDFASGGGGPIAINGHHPECYFDNPSAPPTGEQACENGCAPIGAEE